MRPHCKKSFSIIRFKIIFYWKCGYCKMLISHFNQCAMRTRVKCIELMRKRLKTNWSEMFQCAAASSLARVKNANVKYVNLNLLLWLFRPNKHLQNCIIKNGISNGIASSSLIMFSIQKNKMAFFFWLSCHPTQTRAN